MKIIKINDCGDCNHHCISQLSENVTYCQHEGNQYDVSTGGDPIIPDFPNIPEWCCLEDDDLTPALELLQGYLEKDYSLDSDYSTKVGGSKLRLHYGLEIISFGKTIKELLVNLVKKEGL